MKKLTVSFKETDRDYDILIEKGILNQAEKHLNLNRKVFIITDNGVPREYSEKINEKSKSGYIFSFESGENSKSFETVQAIISDMIKNRLERTDCIVAVGGGVVGDIAGFVASIYMRGIDFYNIPTTLLSQVDSSIGGKTAINFEGIKNSVGTFYQPQKVLIDTELLSTLSQRQLSNGIAESIKMAMTSDRELFMLIEKSNSVFDTDLEEIIYKSLDIKSKIVAKDEKENGIRKVLNFGHTIGHGIETSSNGEILHGEAVALGMLPMLPSELQSRLKSVLEKVNLLNSSEFDTDNAINAIIHDKKFKNGKIDIIRVNKIGSYTIENVCEDYVIDIIKNYY